MTIACVPSMRPKWGNSAGSAMSPANTPISVFFVSITRREFIVW